jgi:6-phosphogluconolactonase
MTIKKFDSKNELEITLVAAIVSEISAAIELYGDARILVSGGGTPLPLYRLLSAANVEWSKVKIGLVDERFVPLESEFNNGSQIQQAFFHATAKSATFIGMVQNSADLSENMELVNENYQLFLDRTDFTLLGMGEDGHTASLFPNDPESEAILMSDALGIFPTKAPNYPFQRITCSKQTLLNSAALVLFIVGEKKLEILNNSTTTHLPISSFLENVPNLEVYYTK